MPWETILVDEFAEWLDEQEVSVQVEIAASLVLLRERGPNLGRPYADTLKGSKFDNLKELRIQISGDPWRVLFAFDTERKAVVLVGGNKTGDTRWYRRAIRLAEKLFQRHLEQLTN